MTHDKCIHHTGGVKAKPGQGNFCRECKKSFIWPIEGYRLEAIVLEVLDLLEKHGNIPEWKLMVLDKVSKRIVNNIIVY